MRIGQGVVIIEANYCVWHRSKHFVVFPSLISTRIHEVGISPIFHEESEAQRV